MLSLRMNEVKPKLDIISVVKHKNAMNYDKFFVKMICSNEYDIMLL